MQFANSRVTHMTTEDPLPTPRSSEDDVFEIGERTIYHLKNQVSPFDADDLGTMIVRPHTPPPAPAPAVERERVDPLERLEDKIDVLTHAIEMLQRRLDSMDAQIARLVSR